MAVYGEDQLRDAQERLSAAHHQEYVVERAEAALANVRAQVKDAERETRAYLDAVRAKVKPAEDAVKAAKAERDHHQGRAAELDEGLAAAAREDLAAKSPAFAAAQTAHASGRR